MKVVYLDNNATTRTAPEVVETMLPYFTDLYGNPSSMHSFGGQVASQVQQAREQVATLIGADPTEIVFTSCGTESDNAALWGTLNSYPLKNHIITTRVEHPAVGNLATYLFKKGYKVTTLPVDREGRLDLDQLAAAMTEETALVSIMWANNETGVLFPIEQIARLVKSRGVVFHTDAVQAVGKLPIDLSKVPVDLLSFSGHKLHAPKGIGVLYIRKGTRFTPFMIGGHQERGRRGGTENVPYIIGLGKACALAQNNIHLENERVRSLRDRLEQGIMGTIPKVLINGHPRERLGNTLSISFEYVEGESILLLLSNLGICASSGSACTSGSLEPSHVLRAMGVPFTAAHGSIRFSLSTYNTEEEIDYVLEHLPPIIHRLREISPFWKEGKGPAARACQ
ncbi:MAG: cysteine desulfurase NifS [Deltaproteobacteria bacterium]|nr:cysteine desulfurase NifS [Deltaproteobacteria bacterium]